MAVDGRRQADPVGQSGRRPRCSARPMPQPLPKKPSDRPTGTGGRSRGSQAGCSRTAPSGWSACRDLARRPAGLRPAAASRLDFPDGSHGVLIAAGNIALIAPRLTQTQSDNEMQPATTSSEPPLSEPVLSEREPCSPAAPVIEQPVAPQPAPDDQQPAPSGEAPAGFALFDAFAEPAAADEPPAAETIPPAAETIARAPPPAIEAFAGQPAGAPPAAALHLADGSGRPLHARRRRIHRPDRPAHHGRFRPAMARDRRDLRIRSHRPGDAGLCDAAPPGAASR